MSRTKSAGLSALAVALMLCTQAVPAAAESALAERTWVSGGLGGTGDLARSVLGSALGIGDDKNPCTRSQPCATLTRALAHTADGGEINVVDSGGFLDSGLLINKSVTIDGGGAFAGVRVGGANAFLIQAGSNDRVILRNLSIDGRGTGPNGIAFSSGGVLHIENCVISNFDGWGIRFAPNAATPIAQLYVANTVLSDNGLRKGTNSPDTDGGGIHIVPQGSGEYRVSLNKVRVEHNRDGITVDGMKGTGQVGGGQISFPAFINVTLEESAAVGNNLNGFTALSNTGKTPIRAILNDFTAANNVGSGIEVAGVSTFILLGNSTITLNGSHGLLALDSGHITSYQNNKINLNGGQPNDPAATGAPTAALQ